MGAGLAIQDIAALERFHAAVARTMA